MWSIIPQTESKMDVDCKLICLRPVLNKMGKLETFTPITPMLQVIVGQNGHERKLKFSLKGALHGQYTEQMPNRMEYQIMKLGRGRTQEDSLSPKKLVKGKRETFASHQRWWDHITETYGQVLALRIRLLFEERMDDLRRASGKKEEAA